MKKVGMSYLQRRRADISFPRYGRMGSMASKQKQNRRIVVLGSNSFSGSDFIDLLLGNPANEIIGISRSPEKSSLFLPYKRHKDARFWFYRLNLNKRMKEIDRVLDSFRPDWVVNFAAQSEVAPSWEWPGQWFQTNAVALSELVAALERGTYLKRYLHISTPEVYGSCAGQVREGHSLDPSTPYAASKAAADLLLSAYFKSRAFPVIKVRSANVYGARQQLWKIIPRTVVYLKLGRKIPLHGGGKAMRSFIHIRDVSRGEVAALEGGRPGAGYHLSTNRIYSIADIVRVVCKMMERNFDTATESVSARAGHDKAYTLNSSLAKEELGWVAKTELEDGIREVIEWVEKNWKVIRRQSLEYIHKR
ncbi:MAG: GDP-mannose 4,6-dehydratase [Candidatus Bathyarchaeota archaeon]|nr:GDP-mannose 4,6-dehydratase [Candidatus Bathyarchaeota archaeon]